MKVKISNKIGIAEILILPIIKNGHIHLNLSKNTKNQINNALQTKDFTGDEDETLMIYDENPSKRILLVGLGNKKDLNSLNYRQAGGNARNALKKIKAASVEIAMEQKYLWPFLEAFLLAGYKFNKYKTDIDKDKHNIQDIYILNESKDLKDLQQELEEITQNCQMMDYVRDMVNAPAEEMSPSELVAQAQKVANLSTNIKLKVLDQKKLKKLGLNAIYTVGKSGKSGSYLILLEYKYQTKNKNPYSFIGKGISFDTGGLHLKPRDNISDMHLDMAGAATVLGLFHKLALNKIPGYFLGVIATAENAIGPDAYHPNDIIKTYSGKTVEIKNTDAEGRLVLCDAISYSNKHYKPACIIDIATLTGAATVSVGDEITPFTSNNSDLTKKLLSAAKKTDDLFWQLPLEKFHIKATKGKNADLTNFTKHMPGQVIMGAAFLANFIADNTPWLHLDIASTSWQDRKILSYIPEGGTGVPLLTLIELVKKLG
ncbi:MAG: leucyl aminopeptidase, leucyl aminopeptidase [Candidatus Peregrinibacteria bacterium GW2011_GWF2_33_10]|nr:MAG: leucyl aminopeptidase, leucyl aminopeptidase [Candidatus Peregrinibacteria bacterium GW2011_GWF2_33_10]OGJ45427.1 MAG: hypothetical protein A2263_04135 [Candidatus Peregrinibacteria bacterium RIFOXYA2_FULL_33_21]OGJ45548.1 MAG: hypothetical protein A2272_01055 [Candidatus Peregrinibacteria bacterium RIFOXYA12_FULL_33_12]OGJ51030.1 MAG: hypothetical protein A2307_05730 [Candidatus Peregrinibacteria bacterium RIFOXYB2_FULL_33_20]